MKTVTTKKTKTPNIEAPAATSKLATDAAQCLEKLAEVDIDQFNVTCRFINNLLAASKAKQPLLLTQPDHPGDALHGLESSVMALEGLNELLWGDHRHNPLEAEHLHCLVMPHLKTLREAWRAIGEFFDAQREWENRYKETDAAKGGAK